MGGCCDPSCAVRKRGEKNAAGCGLLVASILHHFTARLPQVPQLRRQDQIPKTFYLRQDIWELWPTRSSLIHCASSLKQAKTWYSGWCFSSVLLQRQWEQLRCWQSDSFSEHMQKQGLGLGFGLTVLPWLHSPGLQSHYCWILSGSHLERRHSGSGCTAWLEKCWWPAMNGCPKPCIHLRGDITTDGLIKLILLRVLLAIYRKTIIISLVIVFVLCLTYK